LKVRGYTFYHMQGTESAVEGCGLYLYYGAVAEGEGPALRVANEIVDALQRQGLNTEWNGTSANAIKVSLDWKRRLPRPTEARMELTLESGRVISDATEEDIRASIDGEEFAILSIDPNTYIQCAEQRESPSE
jgi:hypothetical protein